MRDTRLFGRQPHSIRATHIAQRAERSGGGKHQ
jgi:hypothetical protein